MLERRLECGLDLWCVEGEEGVEGVARTNGIWVMRLLG